MNQAVDEFVAALKQMTAGSIREAAGAIRRQGDDGDADWLEMTVGIERAVRVYRRPVEAAMAARAAREAVLVAAERCELSFDADVQCVSERAGEVARALVVGAPVLPQLRWLARGWAEHVGARLVGLPLFPVSA